jgi:tetratricopeptide (TPR) repeat protein
MDVERFLNDEPVMATPPSARYKLRKLIKRNKGAFAAAALVFLVLTLGVIGTTWGLVSTRAEFKRAERELTRANEVKRLITDMFDAVSPEVAMGADISLLKGILNDTAKRLASSEVADELIAAELHAVIGRVFVALGSFSEAELHLTTAFEVHGRRLGAEHRQTLDSMNDLAVLRWEQSRYAEAESLYLKLLEVRQRVLGEEHHLTLKIINNLAVLRNFQGRHAEAEALSRRALEIKRRRLGDRHTDTQISMHTLASAYTGLGRYVEAEALYVEALEIARRTGVKEEHPDTLKTMNGLAIVYWNQGRYDDAESLQRRTLEMRRRILGEGHPELDSAYEPAP